MLYRMDARERGFITSTKMLINLVLEENFYNEQKHGSY